MDRRTFAYFVGPSVVIMILLMVLPLATAVYLGFNRITFNTFEQGPQWVGLANYIEVLNDPDFWQSLNFTFLYIVVVVPSVMIIGLLVALVLDQVKNPVVRGFYVAAALLPFIVTPIVGTMMFRLSFERSGIITWVLSELTDSRINFFINGIWVKGLILFHGIWYITPFAMIVLFAGLQTVPKEPLEAAAMDGANWLQRMYFVILPHLRSLFLFIALITIMDGYRIFDPVFVLSKDNPIYEADTIMLYTYRTVVGVGRLGKANAMAMLTVIGIFIVLIPFLYITYRQQVED